MMSKRAKSLCFGNCRTRFLECERNCTIAMTSGDKCSSLTNQIHQHWCVVESVSCVLFYHEEIDVLDEEYAQFE